MTVNVIIPAAGRGIRFGGKKQLALISGKPLLYYSLHIFENCPLVQNIVVAMAEEDLSQGEALVKEFAFKKVSHVVPGGRERQESVQKAFEVLPSCDVVIIHDGVRPLVTEELVQQVVAGAKEFGACVLGLPVKETLKKIGPKGFIQETVDRNSLWSIQTPQAFRYTLFQQAIKKAIEDGFVGTDEAMLVERLGVPIQVVSGSVLNMKITQPEDLEVAQRLLL